MMEWTDRHCRFFHRLLTRRALLYTEMVTTGAVLHGDRARLLGFDPAEHPVALQLGGSRSARRSRECARIGADFGYDEINLNVGCPSDRVQEGRFGACLMAEPALVGDCVAAMKAAVARAGHGEMPHRHRRAGSRSSRSMRSTATVVAAGVDALIVHARKAWLDGPVAAREPRHPAARLRSRLSAQGARIRSCRSSINGGIASVEAGARRISSTSTA